MIGKTARERAARLGLDLGAFKTERELRIAIRRAERREVLRAFNQCCELGPQVTVIMVGQAPEELWCPVHGRL